MDIKKITDFKPDTELRSENPFERTEIDRAKRRYDEPEAKKSKIVSSNTIGGHTLDFFIWVFVELLKGLKVFQNSNFPVGYDILLLTTEFKTKPLVILRSYLLLYYPSSSTRPTDTTPGLVSYQMNHMR